MKYQDSLGQLSLFSLRKTRLKPDHMAAFKYLMLVPREEKARVLSEMYSKS